ncbi:MAG TPA: hypothetical protein VM031_05965 [Phycisphaerae bacterium]|nr:hypothetical protein [Phycisphaerae bacterium]
MSIRRVVVYGDGPYDLGPNLGREVAPDQTYALPRLVHRLLDEPSDTFYAAEIFASVPPVHGRGHKYGRKAQGAIRQARQGRYHAAVIVIDRDRAPGTRKLRPLQEARDQLQHQGFPPCAIGMAVEAFDAWMIADGNAVKAAGGNPAKTHRSPENLDKKEGTGGHPKDLAMQVFGGRDRVAEKYAVVAANADLALLERTCPKGFAPFAEEVREWIGPVVREESGA